MPLDHSGINLTSLAEFVSSPYQNGGNEIRLTQTQCLVSGKQLTHFPDYSNTSILH